MPLTAPTRSARTALPCSRSRPAAVAAVSDVRATELERAAVLDGVFPELDGRPELWCYDYAVRFADEESLSLADQGNWYSIGDGWYDNRQYDVLVVLANADGYRILYTGTWGMVKDYINDSGRTYYREALYDWCADHLALDETDYPRYLHRVTLTCVPPLRGRRLVRLCADRLDIHTAMDAMEASLQRGHGWKHIL